MGANDSHRAVTFRGDIIPPSKYQPAAACAQCSLTEALVLLCPLVGFPFGKFLVPLSLCPTERVTVLFIIFFFFLVAARILTSGDCSTRKLSVPGRMSARAVLAAPQLC